MDPKSLHIDQALSNFSVAYTPSGFIADMVAPIVTVEKESDKYYVWDRSETLRTYDDMRAAGAEAKAIDFSLSNDTYFAEERALKTLILNRSVKNADQAVRLEQNKTKFLKTALMNGRERRVANLFTATGSYAAGLSTTYSGASQWNNGSYTGDPIQEIDAAAEAVRTASGVRPNTLIIAPSVVPVLKNNAKYRDHYKYTAADIAGAGIPPVISGMKVLIPGSQYTSSNAGAGTTTVADVWGKNVVLAYIDPAQDLETLTFAKTFRPQADTVRKYDDVAKNGFWVEDSFVEDVKIVSNVAGYLIKSVIA